jgi:hypothetical protein
MTRHRAHPVLVARYDELVVERDAHRSAGRLLRDGAMESSYVDLSDPSHLEFDYMRWMRIVLRVARARRVIHVGGGACALPRALAAEDPASRHEVCEIDPRVLELARAHLGLRRTRGMHVRQADGRAYIAEQPAGGWDAVVIDAFIGAVIPRHLITAEALADAGRVAPLTLVNVLDNRSHVDLRGVAAGLTLVYRHVWALVGRGGNAVVVGAQESLDRLLIRARAAADPSPAELFAPGEMARLTVTATPWRDPVGDPATSAGPSAGRQAPRAR